MFIKVGKVQVTCALNCDPCPMRTTPVDWEALTRSPCCNNMWVPADCKSRATGKDRIIDKGKAMKLFLQSLGVL